MSSFPSQPGSPFRGIPNETYDFTSSELLAKHPPQDDMSNKVATTGWVISQLTSSPLAPVVSQAGDLTIKVSQGVIETPGGETITIENTIEDISVVANSKEYVYVRYNDQSIVVDRNIPPTLEGHILAEVTTNATNITNIKNYSTALSWATNHSPNFTGEPTTTKPPAGNSSNRIPTTEWVLEMIRAHLNGNINSEHPTVVDAGGLRINVTSGTVTEPSTGNVCEIEPLPAPIGITANAGVDPNPTEKIWVRYSDCSVVASIAAPSQEEGVVLAEVYSDDTKITSISAPTNGQQIDPNYVVAWGGNIISRP